MKTLNTLHHRNGATLIESLVVLSIVAILMNIALFEYKPYLAKSRLENRTHLVKRALSVSRHNAKTHSTYVTFCGLQENQCNREHWHKALTVFIDRGDIGVLDEGDTIIWELEAVDKLDMLTYPRHSITFRSDGTPVGFNNGTFVYCPEYKIASLKGLAISISSIGRIRLKDTNKCQS
ncbi:GspH/FimT family pseudopilin [Pseudoalteromonas sp. bablab_jr011]|uniref:GspH/FimT family pseudopilin n=1 Tax=Pseudoalteromonas sp. bablab_jr011 TaxID=2755062 RepID=UPI0018F7BCEE|nr:GspH/FimT family pseudopilin [Pseudoalteromonas sp. bablab_jr011]